MNIGFIGLGNMGSGMARNLLRAGHALTGYNRTRSRAESLAAEGAQIAASPAEAARDAEAVITMLADDAALEGVVFGRDGILGALPRGAVHISMSTVSPALSRRLAEAHAGAGQAFVAAPVLGRPEAAAAAKLIIIAAGAEPEVARCQPLFGAMGQKTIAVSADPPAANVIKLCCNFFIVSIIESLGESFALARKSGIEAGKLLEVLTGTPITAPLVSSYGGIIANEKYSPAGFRLKLGLKDVRLVLGAGDAAGCPLPFASILRDNFLAAMARGYGDLDWSAIAKLAAENAGLVSAASASG
jgi:3-hydroxyisobutyrate dehydrogenase-like beta-hydroxyacid dehydrogenase